MFGEIDVLSGIYRGSGGGRDGDVPGLERMGEVWVIERNLRENDFLARLLFFTSSCMHMLGKLRPVILECFYSFFSVTIRFIRSLRRLCNILIFPHSLDVNFL